MLWNAPIETLPRAELARLQLDRLQTVLARVYARVPFYRRQFDAAGVRPSDLRGLDDLARFPFTRKADLREQYPFGLFAEPLSRVLRLHASSGTRGKPTVVGYTERDIRTWAECCARCLGAAGAGPDDVVHNAYGYGLFTGGLGFHYGAERMGCTVVPVSGGNTPRQVMLLQDFGARILCCTPSYALNIGEYMQEQGIPLSSIRVRYGMHGAEPWSEEMRAAIEQALGITALDIYGLSEIMGPGVAQECAEEKHGLHVWEDHFLPEIVDPATGEPLPDGTEGELVFTTLTKEAFPMVRYRTGDVASLSAAPCRCGRTHRRMSRLKGRTDDMLIIRGVNVFPSEIERVVLGIAGLTPHYQIVVDRSGTMAHLAVNVEVNEDFYRTIGGDLEAQPPPAVHALRHRAAQALDQALSIHVGVHLYAPHTLPRSEGKAVRVVEKKG
jgi:phenylacetate-CoA ligase